MRARQRAHRLDLLLGHAGGDEAGEVALAVGHAERGVAGADQLARGVHDALEHGVDRALAGDRQDGVAHGLHGAAAALGHRAPRYGAPARAASGAGPRTFARASALSGLRPGQPAPPDQQRPPAPSSTSPPAIQGSGDAPPPSAAAPRGRQHDLVHARLGRADALQRARGERLEPARDAAILARRRAATPASRCSPRSRRRRASGPARARSPAGRCRVGRGRSRSSSAPGTRPRRGWVAWWAGRPP